MKRVVIKIFKVLSWTIVALLLLLFGMIQVVYTDWFQDKLRAEFVSRVNASGELKFTLDELSIDFPLNVSLAGLSVVEPQNDTLIAAKKVMADVGVLPLLRGVVAVDDAILSDAHYRMGNADSVMFMKIVASSLSITDAEVSLISNAIDLHQSEIQGGRIDILLKNDTTSTPADSSQSTPWTINAKDVLLNDFTYHMAIESSIDSLSTHFIDAMISNVAVNLGAQTLTVELLKGEGLDAAFIASDAPASPQKEDEQPSKPWTIMIDSIDFIQSKALYAMPNVNPLPGMDFNYLSFDSLELKVASFYNKASEISIPIRKLTARERSGIELMAKGEFAMDNDAMYLRQFDVKTKNSDLKADGKLGMSSHIQQSQMLLIGNGDVGMADIAMMFPAYKPMMQGVPMHDKLQIDVNIAGSLNDLAINKLHADLGGRVTADAKGHVAYITDFNRVRGTMSVSGEIVDADFVNAIISDDANDDIVLPVMTLSGDVDLSPGLIAGNIDAHTGDGDMALNAKWNSKSEGYDVDLALDEFPIDAFLPRMGIENVSGRLKANGRLLNPFNRNMVVDAEADITHVVYHGVTYNDISAHAKMKNHNAEIALSSDNKGADFDIMACCKFDKSSLQWDVNADIRKFDLYAFKLMEQHASLEAMFNSNGVLDVEKRELRGVLQIDDVDWRSDSLNLAVKDINAKLMASDSVINVALRNNDMYAFMSTPDKIDSLPIKVGNLTEILSQQINARKVDVVQIQQAMPRFNLIMKAGPNNLLSQYLSTMDQSFNRLSLKMSNDSLINLSAQVNEYKMGSTRIDTINLSANQYDKILMYNASIGNRPETLDDFARVTLDGYLADDLVSAHLQQQNIAGEEGYNIGALAQVGDSIVRFELFPEEPMLAYKLWEINDENYIEYNMFTHHVDADVEMQNATSAIKIYTEHDETHEGHQEDVIVNVRDLKLAEIIAFNPYAPSIKGDLSADMRINWGGGRLNGSGIVSLDEFVVGKERVGSFVADLGVSTNASGQIKANAALMVDGVKTMSISGNLNDSTSLSPLMLDFSMIHFPLKVLNPMLPNNIATLSGTLNGAMKISGESDAPIINGKIDFDSTAVLVGMTATPLKFSEIEIPVVDNVVKFNDFAITGVNNNPLKVNGNVDLTDMSTPKIDLTLKARNMQIVGSNKSRRADVYGKGFIDFDADVYGNMSNLNVDATIDLLSGSNVTYIMPASSSAITSYSTEDLVSFVKFSDTTSVMTEEQVVAAMKMNLDVALIVSEGTTINVDLSADGKNKVQLQGSGTLNYSLDKMEDSRITGRYTINKGFVRYTPPLMSEKLFNFVDGSYVAFNGDMLNPVLSLSAIDKLKANVTREGQDSRLVDFEVKLSVTNSLNNMNVAFDLSSPDDLTIANELSSMSAEQRANQAMNMLLYNVYTGSGSKGNSNLSGNPLYSFVESKLNTWAANNIGFVDVSFGIDQYDKTIDGNKSKTTSYSYKVSKTLFNERFKIVVGGNYSTDADADENFSQNLINDISFEYMLNRSGTMYVKLFRQIGFESILEGEVTQTGVGFVYKRKIRSLRDLFR